MYTIITVTQSRRAKGIILTKGGGSGFFPLSCSGKRSISCSGTGVRLYRWNQSIVHHLVFADTSTAFPGRRAKMAAHACLCLWRRHCSRSWSFSSCNGYVVILHSYTKPRLQHTSIVLSDTDVFASDFRNGVIPSSSTASTGTPSVVAHLKGHFKQVWWSG